MLLMLFTTNFTFGKVIEWVCSEAEVVVLTGECAVHGFSSRLKAMVKWSGYPDKFNSWIPLSDLQNLS